MQSIRNKMVIKSLKIVTLHSVQEGLLIHTLLLVLSQDHKQCKHPCSKNRLNQYHFCLDFYCSYDCLATFLNKTSYL